MIDPKQISIHDFTYSLPESRIAAYPLSEREASKLLTYKEGKITEDVYANIADHAPAGSLLVFNDTKVVEARLLFQKPTGGVIEIFCLQPGEQYPDITTAMMQKEKACWQCLVGGASKWKHGQVLEKKITVNSRELVLCAAYKGKKADSFEIEFLWSPVDLSFAEILHQFGAIPLPPYIKRAVERGDAERYQTVYAQYEGSVAAPTAGLHFTNKIFEKLEAKGIQKDFVTLHVGAGTFKPVKAERMEEHMMHAEFIDVSKATIKHIIHNLDNPIIPVGTTSLRTIESLYWLGILSRTYAGDDLSLSQWLPYEMAGKKEETISPKDALQSLLDWMDNKGTERFFSSTQIIIAPGYKTRIAKALVTNFHQPGSTLLLLVAALIGEDWKKIYDYALKNDFRFLSYGDGSLLWVNT